MDDDIELTLREEEAFELDEARTAFEKHRPRFELLPEGAVISVRAPHLSALRAVRRLAHHVQTPVERDRFTQMPGFDLRNVDELESMAAAYWYATIQLRGASCGEVPALVDARLILRANERRSRLLRLLSYHLGDYPLMTAELRQMRLGTGYEDLAADLVRLAELHEVHRAELCHDPRYYHVADAAQARAQAAQILGQLADRREAARRWGLTTRRCAALLSYAYQEVCAAAAWLYRDDPTLAILFPSLQKLSCEKVEPLRTWAPPPCLSVSPG